MKLACIFLFLIVSCSRQVIISEKEKDNNDLLDKVDSKKISLEKFKIKTIPPKKTKKKITAVKKVTLSKKKVVKVAKIAKEEPVEVVLEKKAPKRKKSIYPKDYPEKFKEINAKSKQYWQNVNWRAPVNEEHIMEITFLGLVVGEISIKNHPVVDFAGEKAYRITGNMKSAKYYSYIYELDDSLESIIRARDFFPVRYTLKQRESAQTVDDLQLFDDEKLKTYHWYKRIKKDRNRDLYKEVFIPRYFNDSFSALYFVRSLPLKKGDFYEFPVITRGKMWILKLWVGDITEIKVQKKWVKAHEVRAETHFPGVLKKKGNITFYYSADELKKLLKFEAKVKIGKVEGVMTDYHPGE